MFKFSEEVEKLKTQTLILSGIALFIAITGALPKKIEIIGLDLSGSKTTAGWFLTVLLSYFLLKFMMLAILELCRKWLPYWIQYKGKNLRGDTLNFSESEVYEEYERQDHSEENEDLGTLSGEVSNIRFKQKKLENNYKSKYVFIHNCWVYLSDLFFPVVFGCYSFWAIYQFLNSGIVLKFT